MTHTHGITGRFPRVVAITGGSGLIGRRVVPLLAGAGMQTKMLTRDGRYSPPSTSLVHGDLLDVESLRNLVHGADAIVHLGGMAHSHVKDAEETRRAFAVNVEGTRALFRAAQEAGVARFVLVSSAHVYLGQCGVEVKEDAATSSAGSSYAAMKLLCEQAASEASASGRSVVVLRPCLTYGPGAKHNLKALLRALYRGYYLHKRGAQTVRSFVSVDTMASAILHMLRRPEVVGIYNVTDRYPVRLETWVQHLAEMMGTRKPLSLAPWLLESMATVGTMIERTGLRMPLTRSSLRKLTTSFSLSTERLAATGFEWPSTEEKVLREMVDAEFRNLGQQTTPL